MADPADPIPSATPPQSAATAQNTPAAEPSKPIDFPTDLWKSMSPGLRSRAVKAIEGMAKANAWILTVPQIRQERVMAEVQKLGPMPQSTHSFLSPNAEAVALYSNSVLCAETMVHGDIDRERADLLAQLASCSTELDKVMSLSLFEQTMRHAETLRQEQEARHKSERAESSLLARRASDDLINQRREDREIALHNTRFNAVSAIGSIGAAIVAIVALVVALLVKR